MLKQNNLALVYITDKTFWVGVPTKKQIDLYEVSWNGEDLTTPFAKLKEQFSISQVKIILGNTLAQVAVLKQANDKLNREDILSSVKELFAEDVQDLSFDWKKLEEMDDFTLIEVTAAPNFLLQHIKDAATGAKIKISAIKPVSVLLAEQTKDATTPHLLIWRKQEALALIAHEGFIYQSRDIETYAPQRIQALLNFNLEHAGLPIEQAIISWSETALDQAKSVPEMPPTITATTQRELDVIKFFAQQKQSKGNDASVLDLLRENKSNEEESNPPLKVLTDQIEESVVPSKMPIRNFSLDKSDGPSPNQWIVIAVLILLTAAATALGGYYFLNKPATSPDVSDQIIPTPEAQPTLEPSPEPVDIKTLKIEILNGSGVPGEAGRVNSLLTNAGFSQAETGNADNYDYESTQIEIGEKISQEVTDIVVDALGSYDLDPVKVSSGSAVYDISIIVGSSKK